MTSEQTKFRAIHNGKFIYGFIQFRKKTNDAVMWTENDQGQMTWLHVDKATVGQFAGRKIKGIDLFSGDKFRVNHLVKIVRYSSEAMQFQVANEIDLKNEHTVKVLGDTIWQNPSQQWWDTFRNDMEIIGNIHQEKSK